MDTLVQRFIVAKSASGLAPRSLSWYREQLNHYTDWLTLNGVENERALTADIIEAYLADQRKALLKPATISARYRALSALCGWLVQRRIILSSPVKEVERPRIPDLPVEYVQFAEFQKVYAQTAGNDWIDQRDRCILIILFWSGLRVNELCALTENDVDTGANLITVRKGKGGKGRIVPCPPELDDLLNVYLDSRPPYYADDLFVGSDGYGGVRGPLSEWGVRLMLRRRCKAAGVRHLNPHKFRHGFAMALLNSGMEMSALSSAMGHSSVKVTEKTYARWLTAGVSREYHEARQRLQEQTTPPETKRRHNK